MMGEAVITFILKRVRLLISRLSTKMTTNNFHVVFSGADADYVDFIKEAKYCPKSFCLEEFGKTITGRTC